MVGDLGLCWICERRFNVLGSKLRFRIPRSPGTLCYGMVAGDCPHKLRDSTLTYNLGDCAFSATHINVRAPALQAH